MTPLDVLEHLLRTTDRKPWFFDGRTYILTPLWAVSAPGYLLSAQPIPLNVDAAKVRSLFAAPPIWPFQHEIDNAESHLDEGGESSFYDQLDEEGDFARKLDGVSYSATYLYEFSKFPGARVTVQSPLSDGPQPLWIGSPFDLHKPVRDHADLVLGRLSPWPKDGDCVPW